MRAGIFLSFLSCTLNNVLREKFCLEELLSVCPHGPRNPFHTHINPPATAAETHVHKTNPEHRPLGVRGGKNHQGGAEKENVTLLLPNSVAKLHLPTPSLVLYPQKQKELGCTAAAVGTAETDS